MKRNLLKLSLLIGGMILIALAVSFLFPSPPQPPVKSLPDPNGYDVFLKAAAMLPLTPGGYEKMDHEGLLAFVEGNTNALQVARTGLLLDCQVPVELSPAFLPRQLNEMAGMKKLATAFAAEASLANMENRPKDAAKSCVDTLRLGTEIGRGGLLIHALIGLALESMGMRELQRLPGRLDAAAYRETIKALESIDARREPWKEILHREHDWSGRFASFRERITRIASSASTKAAEAKAESRYNDHVAAARHMMIQFAGLAFEQENLRKAKGFSDLVPEYLKAIPQDPKTGTEMIFLP